VSEEENKNAGSSLKLVSFECLKKSAESFVFVREDVHTTEQLSDENNNHSEAPESLLRAMFPPSQPVKLERLLMFIQHPNKLPEKIDVAVPEDCTVDRVVELTKVSAKPCVAVSERVRCDVCSLARSSQKAYSERFKGAAAGVVDRQWILRQAEDDGTVEDDDPRTHTPMIALGAQHKLSCDCKLCSTRPEEGDPGLHEDGQIVRRGVRWGRYRGHLRLSYTMHRANGAFTTSDATRTDSRAVAKLVKINLPNCGSQVRAGTRFKLLWWVLIDTGVCPSHLWWSRP
jgi:hypothetical protein